MFKFRIFITFVFLLLFTDRVALSVPYCDDCTLRYPRNWFFKGNVGVSLPTVSSRDRISPGLGWPNDLYRANHINTAPIISLTLGSLWNTEGDTFPYFSLGLNYTYMPPTEISGYIKQYSLPEFNNYNFKHKVERHLFMAIGKLNLFWRSHLMPFLTAGVGGAFNRSFNYHEHAKSDVTPRVSPGYGDVFHHYLAYLVGIGIDFEAEPNWWINFEYNYQHYGRARTGKGQNLETLTGTNYASDSLQFKVQGSAILMGVTYLFKC